MDDVRRAFEIAEFIHGDGRITRDVVNEWMKSDDCDVIGAAYVATARHAERIDGIGLIDLAKVTLKVFALGLDCRSETDYGLEPPDSDLVMLRVLMHCSYATATDETAKPALRIIVQGLRRLYKSARVKDRERIVHGMLEHAFECPSLRHHFRSWTRDRVLRKAYREAASWADRIGADGVLGLWQTAGVLPKCCDDASHHGRI